MDLKIYERTRYQNIYRHKKNKNYVIMMSKPVKTSISRVDEQKITTLDEALKIRDNVLLKQQKGLETIHKEDFDTLWEKYIDNCKYVKKLSYNTLVKKQKSYNRYLKNKICKPLSKTNKDFWAKFIDDFDCSLKQKNQIIKELKAFFNWCIIENLLISNPIAYLTKYKIVKAEMKYWIPSELKTFLDTLDNDIKTGNIKTKQNAYRIKILTLIGFSLGDRVGESRALAFNNFDKKTNTVTILHSINYDRNSDDFISNTKTYSSQRTIDVSDKLIEEVYNYKNFLKNECKFEVNDDSLIFFNYKNNMPYSDVALRKLFYKYCEKANVKKIRMYDLRHTYVATMMAEGKELYYISDRIGHTNYNTTVKKYGHLSNEVRKEIAKITDKYI